MGQAPLVGTSGPHRRTADADGAHPRPHGALEVAETPCQTNQTSNQTSGGGLVSWPRLPRFVNFPFRFPFRGEKGSAPLGWGRAARAHIRKPSKVKLELRSEELRKVLVLSRRKNAQKLLLRGPKHRNHWAFRYCGPPPPRQAAGDLARASKLRFLASDRIF